MRGQSPPQRLAELNYIFFYPEPKSPGSGWGTGLAALASALNTDLDWLREHTRYLRLAKEWEEVGKPSDRRLLSAADIGLARKWVADRPKEAPAPTALQLDFIEASKTEDNRRQREVQRQKREAEQAKRVARRTLMGLAAAVILALAASGFAFVAYQQRQTALLVTATAKSERNKAEEQRRLAEQASDTAKKERDKAQKATQEADAAREETQRQLDRAN